MLSADSIALTEHEDPNVAAAKAARQFALHAALHASLSFESVGGFVREEMRGDGGQAARSVAATSGLSEEDARDLISDALGRYYLARRMAALPPAMRDLAIVCRDPSLEVLRLLMQLMPDEDRHGMEPGQAARKLHVVTHAQALERARHMHHPA